MNHHHSSPEHSSASAQHNNKLRRLETLFPFIKHTWFRFLRFVVVQFEHDHCREKAASLTYTTMLSIVPMLTVLLVILSSVPALQTAKRQIQQLIYTNLLPSSSSQLSQYLDNFATQSTHLTLAGVVILFITTVMMLNKVETAFNRIWRVPNSGYNIMGFMRYWTLVSLGPIVLGTAFVLSSTVASLRLLNQQFAGYAIDWGTWVQLLFYMLTFAGFTAIYWFVPNTHVRFKSAAIAGAIIAVTFETLKSMFGIIMTNFTSYQLIYGAFAALPVLLLWIYLSWCLILAGVEISRAISVFDTQPKPDRHPLFALLGMLELMHTNQKHGHATSEIALQNKLGRHEILHWHDYKQQLIEQRLIEQSSDGDYLLKRHLSELTLWEFYKQLPYALPHKNQLLHSLSQSADDTLYGTNDSAPLTHHTANTIVKNPAHAHAAWQNYLNQQFLASDRYLSKKLDTPLAELFEKPPNKPSY